MRWFTQAKSQGLQISGPMLQQKAKDLGKTMGISFDPTLSWVQQRRKCQVIVSKWQHDKKQNHNSEAAEYWASNVWPYIHFRYVVSDIYNCDKTGLYFQEQCPSEQKSCQVAKKKNV